jgi:hypothetical protein
MILRSPVASQPMKSPSRPHRARGTAPAPAAAASGSEPPATGMAAAGGGFSAALRENALVEWFAEYDGAGNMSPSYPEPMGLAEVLGMASDAQRKEWEEMQLGYAAGSGGAELRAAVAQLYPTLSPADVLSCVPDEGIFLALMALLAPGDEVIVTCPAYASLYEICHAQRCTVRHWLPAVAAQGGEREPGELWFDPEEMRGLITPKTRLVVVNFRETHRDGLALA